MICILLTGIINIDITIYNALINEVRNSKILW